MTTLTVLKLERAALNKAVITNTVAINEKKSKTVITCETNMANGHGCGSKFFIKNITYIQTHWYETPSGCTGGDMWHQGEGQFECPCCGLRNRLYNRESFQALKGLFKHVVDEHKD